MPGVQMPSPIKRAGSQNYYYRSAVPMDLRPILAALPKSSRPKGWGTAEIWLSLGTSDRAKAKGECAKATAEVERMKAALRTGARRAFARAGGDPSPLTDAQAGDRAERRGLPRMGRGRGPQDHGGALARCRLQAAPIGSLHGRRVGTGPQVLGEGRRDRYARRSREASRCYCGPAADVQGLPQRRCPFARDAVGCHLAGAPRCLREPKAQLAGRLCAGPQGGALRRKV